MSITRTYLADNEVNDLTPPKLYIPGAFAAITKRKSPGLFQSFPNGDQRYKYELSEIINNWLQESIIGGHVNLLTSTDTSTIQNPHHGDIAISSVGGTIYLSVFTNQWNGPYQLGVITSSSFTNINGWYVATGTITDTQDSIGVNISIPLNTKPYQITVVGDSTYLDSNNDFKIRFLFDPTEPFNQSVNTMWIPTIQVWDTSTQLLSGPTNSLPFVLNHNTTIQTHITNVSNGGMTIKLRNMNTYSNWAVTFSF